jgi:hypothetical protein
VVPSLAHLRGCPCAVCYDGIAGAGEMRPDGHSPETEERAHIFADKSSFIIIWNDSEQQ